MVHDKNKDNAKLSLLDLSDKERNWFDRYLGYLNNEKSGMLKFHLGQGNEMFGVDRVTELVKLTGGLGK